MKVKSEKTANRIRDGIRAKAKSFLDGKTRSPFKEVLTALLRDYKAQSIGSVSDNEVLSFRASLWSHWGNVENGTSKRFKHLVNKTTVHMDNKPIENKMNITPEEHKALLETAEIRSCDGGWYVTADLKRKFKITIPVYLSRDTLQFQHTCGNGYVDSKEEAHELYKAARAAEVIRPHDNSLVEADPVNHPPHYTSHPSGIECIQVTEHMGFNLGNAVKYIWRADLKGKSIEDLKKAAWYIQREIEKREKEGQS